MAYVKGAEKALYRFRRYVIVKYVIKNIQKS